MEKTTHDRARLLVVDDQEVNIRVLEGVLRRAGFVDVRSTQDPREAVALYAEVGPDIVLLDLHMPHMDGFELLAALRARTPPGDFLPRVVLTADITPEAKRRALSEGASDFLTKPFDATEVVLRVNNLLETRRLHLQLRDQNVQLEERVAERTHELVESRIEILERLSLAAEYRDDDTGQHTKRVGRNSSVLAAGLGLEADQVELLRRVAPLHDVGKIGIPDHILLHPGRLSPEAFEVMKTHAAIGAGILSGSRSPLLRVAEEIALTHHERWDGTGYPRGLVGGDIPLSGRIVAVVDVFDALTHHRPYKAAWPVDEAVSEIERQAGRQFDSAVTQVFLKLVGEGQIVLEIAG